MKQILAIPQLLLVSSLTAPTVVAQGIPTAPGRLDFPLQPKSRWTYHLHQENGEGVHFGELDAKLAKGRTLDTTVTATVTGSESLHGGEFLRIDSTRSGKAWLSEWYRAGADGVLLGKTVDAEAGQETLMVPPQRVLSAKLQK